MATTDTAAEYIVIFDFPDGTRVMQDEEGRLEVFRSVAEAREAIRGHVSERLARIVELDP